MSLSGIDGAVCGEFDVYTDVGGPAAITTTTLKAAINSMPKLMIGAQRRSCVYCLADRNCAGVA